MSIEKKAEILHKFDLKGKSTSEFARELKLSESTVRSIVTKRKVIDEAVRNKSCKRLRLKAGKYEDLEEILASWMRQARASSIPIDGDVLKTKALKIAKELNTPNFTASNGWLH